MLRLVIGMFYVLICGVGILVILGNGFGIDDVYNDVMIDLWVV